MNRHAASARFLPKSRPFGTLVLFETLNGFQTPTTREFFASYDMIRRLYTTVSDELETTFTDGTHQ